MQYTKYKVKAKDKVRNTMYKVESKNKNQDKNIIYKKQDKT